MALIGATSGPPVVVAVVVAPVAAVAAASVVHRHGQLAPRARLVAGLGAALVPFAAVAGWEAAVAVAVAVALAVVAVGGGHLRSATTAVWPALAAATLVLADHGSIGTGLSLAAAICLFDLANYVMGTGSTGGFLGALSGIVAVAVLAVLAAAVVNPPFSGDRAWVVFGLVAVLCPLGIILGRRVAGGVSLPALRRLDSLLLAGPAWVVASHLVLR